MAPPLSPTVRPLGKGASAKPGPKRLLVRRCIFRCFFQSMKISDMGLLPLLCGLAAARSLGAAGRIKWPNDVLLGEKSLRHPL